MASLTKNPHPPNQKIFFQVQATRLAASVELLTGSVAHTRPVKFPRKAMCVSVFFLRNPQKQPDAKELKTCLLSLNACNVIQYKSYTIIMLMNIMKDYSAQIRFFFNFHNVLILGIFWPNSMLFPGPEN